MAPVLGMYLFENQPLMAFGIGTLPAVSFANARSYGNKNVDYIPSQKPAKTPKVPIMTRARRHWDKIVDNTASGLGLNTNKHNITLEALPIKETAPGKNGKTLQDYMAYLGGMFGCFRAPSVHDNDLPSSLPAGDLATTSGRDHAASAAPPMSMTMDRETTTIPQGDGSAIIQLAPPMEIINPSKAALAALLKPPPGYVRLTAEERAAAVAAGKAAREAERQEMEARMAAADAKARAAAAQGAGSFFGDMAGLGEGEELGGSMEDEEDDGRLEEEEEGSALDGAHDATFGDMADWEPAVEDAVAAGRIAFLKKKAQQEAFLARFNAGIAAKAQQ